MLSSFLKIKVFCLLFKKATNSAKLTEKTTWSYKLGDPDMLFHLHERHSYLAEMEHKERNSENTITRHMENYFQASLFEIKKC